MFVSFVDCRRAFDLVRRDRLLEVVEGADIPELERGLVVDLCWHSQATVG